MLEIINLEGEVLLKSRFKDNQEIKEINSTRLPEGVYFVRIQYRNCVHTTKLHIS